MKRSFDRFSKRLREVGLKARITEIAAKRHVTLQALYEDAATASVVAARKDVYVWLKSNGKSPGEIGKLFDRAPNGILKLLRAPKSAAKARR